MNLVIDTNVFIGALLSSDGANREVIRRCLLGQYRPLMGAALLAEYEDVLGRHHLFKESPINDRKRLELFEALLSVSRWTQIFYTWRPNLPDEGDNHLVELAIAGDANAIITRNLRDLNQAELHFPHLRILTPVDLIKGRV